MKHALLIAATLVALAGCKKKVDSKDFEGRVKKRMTELGFPEATASCPKDIAGKVGTEFTCKVGLDGTSFELVVTITEVSGDSFNMTSTWKDGEAVVSARLSTAVANELTKKFGAPVAIDCSGPLRFLAADRTVRCALSSGATRTEVIVTFDDKLEATDLKLVPDLIAKAKLEEILAPTIEEKTGVPVTVSCGTEPLTLRPADGVVTCDVLGGPQPARVKLTLDEDLVPGAWEIVAP